MFPPTKPYFQCFFKILVRLLWMTLHQIWVAKTSHQMAVVQQELNDHATSITVDNYERRCSASIKKRNTTYLPSQGMLASDGSYYIPTRPMRTSHVAVQEHQSDQEPDDDNDGESNKNVRKLRRKSVVRRMWKYVKESWLGVMSGTGKGQFVNDVMKFWDFLQVETG